jgi:hypothetical protein
VSRRPYIKELPRAYREQYDAEIAANEPVIEWVKNNHGIWVHVSIHDPHVDSAHNAEKTSCKRGHRYTDENTIFTSDGFRQCRKCTNENRKPLTPEQKQRANEVRNRWRQRLRDERANPECTDAALLAAARTDI